MSSAQLYDTIGATYTVTRRTEPRIADAAMAVCTVHHWQDPIAGLREMRRVAHRVVVFLFDTSDPGQFWLTRDYLPEFAALRSCRVLASLTELARAIGARMEPVPHPVGLR